MKAGDKVVCKDASGPYMEHLTKDKEYIVESVSQADIRLMGVLYSTKVWRFELSQ